MKANKEFDAILTESTKELREAKLREAEEEFMDMMDDIAENGDQAAGSPAQALGKIADLGDEEYSDSEDPESAAFEGDLSWTGANKVEG
jgi:hypothetical protein